MQRLPGNHHMVPEINIMNGFLLKGESKEKKTIPQQKGPALGKKRGNLEKCYPVVFSHAEEGCTTWQRG